MAERPADAQDVQVFVALGSAQVGRANTASFVHATERSGDNDLGVPEYVGTARERVLEDRASLVGVHFGVGPPPGAPLEVAERGHEREWEHQHPALAHERVVFPAEHAAGAVQLSGPQQPCPHRDGRRDLPGGCSRQELRTVEFGRTELDLAMTAGRLVERQRGGGRRDQRLIVELDGDAKGLPRRFGGQPCIAGNEAALLRVADPRLPADPRIRGDVDGFLQVRAEHRSILVLGLRPEHERLRSHRGWKTRIEHGLDSRSRLWNVAGFHQVAGTYERSADAFHLAFRRREAYGLGRKYRGGVGRSALGSGLCRSFHDGCDPLVGRRRRKREVSCLLFQVVHELGRLQVHGAAASRGHVEVHGCSEQGVCEADDAVAAGGECPGCGGFVHERLGVDFTKGLREQGRRWALNRRDELEERPRVLRECSDAIADELLERRRDRQLRLQIRGLPLDCPREFECEHRVAARCGVDGCHLRPRDAHVEPLAQKLLEMRDCERPDLELRERSWLKCVRKSERIWLVGSTSQGREDADRLLADAADREREHACRRGVEPLDVVDREEQWRIAGEGSKRGDKPT